MVTERSDQWTTVYLGMGSNLGDREASILSALKELDTLPTIQITAVSSLYDTAPVGVTDQPNFVNAVAEIQTTLTPDELLGTILALEKNRGRVRTQHWGPRVIDIDILTYGSVQRETPVLTLPHPHLTERDFVLVPLAEIAPDLVLPGQKDFIKKIVESLPKTGNILSVKPVEESSR